MHFQIRMQLFGHDRFSFFYVFSASPLYQSECVLVCMLYVNWKHFMLPGSSPNQNTLAYSLLLDAFMLYTRLGMDVEMNKIATGYLTMEFNTL